MELGFLPSVLSSAGQKHALQGLSLETGRLFAPGELLCCFGSVFWLLLLLHSFFKLAGKMFLQTSEFILLLPSMVTLSVKIHDSVPEEAMLLIVIMIYSLLPSRGCG